MSTRSFIAIKTREGYKAIYCHFDGYPDHMLNELTTYFSIRFKVKNMIKGDATSINKGVVKYMDITRYTHPTIHRCLGDLLDAAQESWAEYVYVFVKNAWSTYSVGDVDAENEN